MASLLGWSELPRELLNLISTRLSFADCFRFAAVCTSWRSLAAQRIRQPLPPLLMLQTSKDDHDRAVQLQCFTFWQEQFHRILDSKRLAPGQTVVPLYGSSRGGWLLITDKKQGLLLMNLFTGKQISLPPISLRAYAAALSSSPTSGQDCVLAVLGHCSRSLMKLKYMAASCRPSDRHPSWSTLTTAQRGYLRSMVFHDGELYVLEMHKMEIYVFDPIIRRRIIWNCSAPRHGPSDMKLVDSDGDLLLVVMPNDHTLHLFKHLVLGDILIWMVDSDGDRVLLLTDCRAESFHARDFEGNSGFRSNCVYYSDGRSAIHVYQLEDGQHYQINLSVPGSDLVVGCDWIVEKVG